MNFALARLAKVILSLSKEDFCDSQGGNRLKSPFD